jgi:hypothetical protein
MPEYYLYTIKKDGHSAGPPKVVECQDDEAAVKKAKQLLDDRLIEIWEGARVVVHVKTLRSQKLRMLLTELPRWMLK